MHELQGILVPNTEPGNKVKINVCVYKSRMYLQNKNVP